MATKKLKLTNYQKELVSEGIRIEKNEYADFLPLKAMPIEEMFIGKMDTDHHWICVDCMWYDKDGNVTSNPAKRKSTIYLVYSDYHQKLYRCDMLCEVIELTTAIRLDFEIDKADHDEWVKRRAQTEAEKLKDAVVEEPATA